MKTAVVTGCLGFIGSALCRRLLDGGWEVTGIDRDTYFNGMASIDIRQNRRDSLIYSKHGDRFHFVARDISDSVSDIRIPQDAVVFHLAAIANISASAKDPSLSYWNNVSSTVNAIGLAHRYKARRFVFVSSAAVYGNLAVGNGSSCTEDFPLCPINAYGASKMAGEVVVRAFSEYVGMESVVLRPFSVYGPGMPSHLAISKVADSIQHKTLFQMRGDGSAERDYTYIDDMVSALVCAAKAPLFDNQDGAKCCTFNICGGNPISLKQVISSLERDFRKKAKVRKFPAEDFDAVRTAGDNSAARKFLRWKPKVSFAEGISRFVKWRKEQPRCCQATN